MKLLDSNRLDHAGTGEGGNPRPTFAEVYDEHLDAIWRFLRSRVDDQHTAEDLASDVFVRAWRSWDRFDHTRGAVGPWLWTIAHRTLVDHWRRIRPEPLAIEDGDMLVELDRLPEDEVLREDLLARLGAALHRLPARERDALAMRFAAQLPVADIAMVLGLGLSATKMLLHRAIDQLRLAVDDVAPTEIVGQADLEAVIDDILDRGTPAMRDGNLASLLVHLAAAHDAPTPPTLHDEIADCVQCETTGDRVTRTVAAEGRRSPRRARLAGIAAAVLFFVPVCLACTVSIASLVVGAALGGASVVVHELTLLTTPVIIWMLAVARRRHGGTLGFRLAAAGGVVLVVHSLAHVGWYLPETWALNETLWAQPWAAPTFEWTNRVGTALLVAGAAASFRASRRWRRHEAELVAVLARDRRAVLTMPAA